MLLGGKSFFSFVGILFISTGYWVAAQCPTYSEVASEFKNTVYGACIWEDGNRKMEPEDPMFACNGERTCFKDGDQIPGVGCFGTLMVLPGCSVMGFTKKNFNDKNIKFLFYKKERWRPFTGPKIVTRPDFDERECIKGWFKKIFKIAKYPKSYFGAMIVTCEHEIPNCENVKDGWETIGEFDNTESSDEGEFTLTHKTGVTHANKMEDTVDTGIDGDLKIEGKGKVPISEELELYLTFSVHVGTSVETGYNWKKFSSRAYDDATEYDIEIKVPPKQRLVIQKVVGYCGGSTVHTEAYRALSYKTSYSDSKKQEAKEKEMQDNKEDVNKDQMTM